MERCLTRQEPDPLSNRVNPEQKETRPASPSLTGLKAWQEIRSGFLKIIKAPSQVPKKSLNPLDLPSWVAQLSENSPAEEIPKQKQNDRLDPPEERAVVQPELIVKPANSRPAKPVLDHQIVDVHYRSGLVNMKKVKETIEDYSNHGYILSLAYPKHTSEVESIATALVFHGRTEMSLSTELDFNLLTRPPNPGSSLSVSDRF